MDQVWSLKETNEVENEHLLAVVQTDLFSVVSVVDPANSIQNDDHVEENITYSNDVKSLKLNLNLLEKLNVLESKYPAQILSLYRKIGMLRDRTFNLRSLSCLPLSPEESRVANACKNLAIKEFSFVRVTDGYYERTLSERCKEVGAISSNHLCKSLLYQTSEGDTVMIIVQYAHEVNTQKLEFLLGQLDSRSKPLKVSIRFLDEVEAQKMTGFKFNAIAPVGFLDMNASKKMKIIISESIFKLVPGEVFLGGGHVHTKLRVGNIYEFSRKVGAFRLDVSQDRVE